MSKLFIVYRHILIQGILAICVLFFTIKNSYATCSTKNSYITNVPLQATTFSVGEDFPVGTNIRNQYVRGIAVVDVSCTKNGGYIMMSLSGGTLYPGQSNIYQTGITGLGVRFRNIYENKFYPFNTTYLAEVDPDGWLDFTIELIKMGPITAGSINFALFPMVKIDAIDADKVPARVAWHTITGNFTLQTPTCQTPNFNWDIGTTNTTILKNVGDASSWVDTPVRLTGCSTFLGNNSNGSYTKYSMTAINAGTVSQVGTLASNTLTMTLRANTSAIDSTNGVVSLDNTSTASGFGVQVGIKNSGTYTPQNLNNSTIITPAIGDNSGTFSFPLGARIIRTSNSVIGGSVKTSLTYTITYK